MSSQKSNKRTLRRFLFENSIFLIAGAVIALVWANTDFESYHAVFNTPLWDDGHGAHEAAPADPHAAAPDDAGHADDAAREAEVAPGDAHDAAHGDGQGDGHGQAAAAAHAGGGHHTNTLHFIINGFLMALFFAIAGKEVWESLLPGGALSSPKKAGTPLFATLGGMVGPAGLYLLGVWIWDESGVLTDGWAIPCATDIAFSYLVARFIFGPGHPAIAFLLLLAIADDAGGLIILAIFYPKGQLALGWLGLTIGAVVLGFLMRRFKLQSFWWYLLVPGSLSWFSLHMAGFEPALGLVPIIPCMPHAHTDLGIFAKKELGRHDTLNEFEHWFKNPVEIILGLFGLANAGVAFTNAGLGTSLVLLGLLVGKPLGVLLFTWFSEKVLKFEVPEGMSYRHVLTVGMIAGIGFTVALFVATAAFPVTKFAPEILDAAKMGALLSFAAAILAIVGARLMGIRPVYPDEDSGTDASPDDGAQKSDSDQQLEDARA